MTQSKSGVPRSASSSACRLNNTLRLFMLSVFSIDIVLAPCQDTFDTEELVTGAELRKKRLAVGLSQEALARALSVSVSSVSKWESGARRIRPFAVHAIETVLTQLERQKLVSQQR